MLNFIVDGELLACDNPFSVAREPRARATFTKANDRVHRAWSRTILSLPGALIAAALTGPFARWGGLEAGPTEFMARFGATLPLCVIAYGLATGLPAFRVRRNLLRDADTLGVMERGRDTLANSEAHGR